MAYESFVFAVLVKILKKRKNEQAFMSNIQIIKTLALFILQQNINYFSYRGYRYNL